MRYARFARAFPHYSSIHSLQSRTYQVLAIQVRRAQSAALAEVRCSVNLRGVPLEEDNLPALHGVARFLRNGVLVDDEVDGRARARRIGLELVLRGALHQSHGVGGLGGEDIDRALRQVLESDLGVRGRHRRGGGGVVFRSEVHGVVQNVVMPLSNLELHVHRGVKESFLALLESQRRLRKWVGGEPVRDRGGLLQPHSVGRGGEEVVLGGRSEVVEGNERLASGYGVDQGEIGSYGVDGFGGIIQHVAHNLRPRKRCEQGGKAA